MATIDAAKLPIGAVKALESGREVKLTRAGKAIAILYGHPLRPRMSVDRAKKILKQIREADRRDNWSDFVDWNA